LAEYLAAPPQPRHGRAILITFDDGYRNFADAALPLLRRFGFTATLFVPVDYVGKRPSWLESNHATARLLLNQLGFPGRERQRLEDGMAALAREPLLDWPALRDLVAAGIDVQSHGAGHGFLTRLPPEEAAADLARSRSVLEDRLGAPVRTIAYPYGACDKAVAALAGRAGFTAGFISDYGPRDTGGLMRWRAGISSLTTPRELSAMMASWPLHPRLRCLARRVDLARPT
jgi:peptidoglycan/xylan/chitin deacetylase (PgdA/CDA1 family)